MNSGTHLIFWFCIGIACAFLKRRSWVRIPEMA